MALPQTENHNEHRRTGRELHQVEILAVKAAEENSELISALASSSASISAIGARSDMEYVTKRALYLFKALPDPLRYLSVFDQFPSKWIKGVLLMSFLAGIFSNYLGPTQLIHVIYNPLTILLAWTILVYLIMILKSLLKIPLPAYPKKPAEALEEDSPREEQEEEAEEKPRSFLERAAGWVVRGLVQLRSRWIDNNTRMIVLKKVLPAFWRSYSGIAGRSLVLRFKSLMNVGALGLLAGALVGVYFRGLFFNYNIIWQSTFVTEPDTIRKILSSSYGLASVILYGHPISIESVMDLLQPAGSPAGPWIHMMALTTLFIIFIPRAVLAIHYARKARKKIGRIDLHEDYFREKVLKERGSLLDVIREGIRDIISKKIDKTGKTISQFVIDDYYEKLIVPILMQFRKKGGKIKELERQLYASREEFEPILLRYLAEVQEEFRDAVLTELNLFLGRKLVIDLNTVSSYQPRSGDFDQQLSNRIASEIGDTIGGTIVTTVALAAGSISGGIGKSLGIAIISGLLGVSGPVGLLIGGLAAAITLGGMYKMKREQISAMVKEVPLPSFVVSVTLSDAKIEKARRETYKHTRQEIRKMLDPKIDEVAEHILKDLTY